MAQETEQKPEKKEFDVIKINHGTIIKRRKKRKTAGLNDKLTRQELLHLIEKIPENIPKNDNIGLMYRALISIIYLTGGRISEILALKPEQVEIQEDIVVIDKVKTLKRKDNNTLRPIFLKRDFEYDFLVHFLRWHKEVIKKQMFLEMDLPLFKIKPSRAWQILYKYTGKYPHFFRHMRSEDLIKYYGFDSYWLQRWHNWKKLQTSENYVHLLGEDLKKKVREIEPKRNF